MNSTLRVVISRSLIQDKISELLYQLRLIHPNTNINSIDFKDLFNPSQEVEMYLNLRHKQEGAILQHHG
jgi:hypothetical protein